MLLVDIANNSKDNSDVNDITAKLIQFILRCSQTMRHSSFTYILSYVTVVVNTTKVIITLKTLYYDSNMTCPVMQN
jgi:hypothetical protein